MTTWRLDECAFCHAPTWCRPRAKSGKPQCKACEVERFFRKVLYEPLGFDFIGWQGEYIRKLYGTTEADAPRRQFHESYNSLAKKNGKSFLVAGLPLYHLTMEDEWNQQIFGAASSLDQAGYVFDHAATMVQKSRLLSDRLQIIPSRRRIVRRDGHGTYRIIAAEGRLKDGLEPSMVVIDELHRWTHEAARILYDILSKGTISRAEPLQIEITTAGDQYESEICWRQHQRAQQVLAGTRTDPRFLPVIYSADEHRVKHEPDFWKSREARVQANPSHEDRGGFLRDDNIVKELQKAEYSPTERAAYWRYHLNIWVRGSEIKAIDPVAWDECGIGVRNPLEELFGMRAYAGVDLSLTTDLTACGGVIPLSDGTVEVFAHGWMPEGQLKERIRRDRIPYDKWAKAGVLTLVRGDRHDESYTKCQEYLRLVSQRLNLRQVGYDQFKAEHFANAMVDQGFQMIKVGQGYNLSEATKRFIALVGARQLRHNQNPLLTWCVDCLDTKNDGNDNIRPIKPNREKDTKRIDLAMSIIMAMFCWLRDMPKKSAYENIEDCVL